MKSNRPKVLHEILGKPMVNYVVDAARILNPERIIAVLGHGSERVREALAEDVRIAIQETQQGTGHALMQAMPQLEDFDGRVAILCGDTPLISETTLEKLVETQERAGAAAAILTAVLPNPTGYGRIIRRDGLVARIVEERDATPEERQVAEVNSGTYCFEKEALLDTLHKIEAENDQAEYYLTDAIEILTSSGEKVVAYATEEPAEALGVNSRVQLAEATRIMRHRINERHMLAGVTIVEPETAFIAPDVTIGRDTVLYPNCFLEEGTVIGEECRLGPNARLVGCTLGNRVCAEQAVLKSVVAEDDVALGPFCHVRPGTIARRGSKIGGFVEVKKSEIGEGAKVPHLSYVGDAEIGSGANLGAGTITCNYDGFKKHKTVIEENAFVGSDTMLVAPVTVGKGAVVGAGSTITEDVPEDALALARSRQRNFSGWAGKRREEKGRE